MNTPLIITQFKRELWENKVSFLVAPVLVSLLVLAMAICASFYAGGAIHKNGVYFSTTIDGKPTKVGVRAADDEEGASIGAWESANTRHVDAVTSVLEDPKAFDNMVSGAMYANCVLLYVVFAIVIGGYSLRCLFDDRKNRDILFWRSMPVSETTNVLVKLATIMVVAPVITLLLNLLVTLVAIILGLVFFGIFGVGPGVILSSIFHGQALYLPFIVFYELLFSFMVLSPVFGFALFASALAKKSPFFLFASPLALVFVDLLMQKSWGLTIGVVDLFKLYFAEFAHMRSAFVLKEALVFDASMILPLVICIGTSVLFIGAAIWLRNNRYEI